MIDAPAPDNLRARLDVVGARLTEVSTLIESYLEGADETVQADHGAVDQFISQGRTAVVALNGSGLVALVALAGSAAISAWALKISVSLLFLGLVAGLASWIWRTAFHSLRAQTLIEMSSLQVNVHTIRKAHGDLVDLKASDADERLDDLIAEVTDAVRLAKRTKFLASMAEGARRIEPYALGGAMISFLLAVLLPVSDFVARPVVDAPTTGVATTSTRTVSEVSPKANPKLGSPHLTAPWAYV